MDPQENDQQNNIPERGTKQIADAELQGKRIQDSPDLAPQGESPGPGIPLPTNALEEIPNSSEDLRDFKGVEDSLIPEQGENNLPPMELNDENTQEILKKQSEDDKKREEIRNQTKKFENGANEWKLISKVYNNTLDWEHTTMAMRIGTRGVIVHIKEAVGQKVNATSVYIDNGQLIEKNGKWFLK